MTQSSTLLRRVARRLRLVAVGRQCFRAFLVLGVLYGLILLASRLCGLVPDHFQPATLLAVPALAVLFSLAVHRRPGVRDAAHEVDRYLRTKDLFLTAALLDGSPAQFKPLVAAGAEQKAAGVRAGDVVPFHGARRLGSAVAALCVLWAGIQFLPQLDPFGKVAEAEEVGRRKSEIAEARKATSLRADQVRKELDDKAQAKEVEQAVDELKTTFDKAKADTPKINLERLVVNQQQLGQKWRELSAQKLNELLAEKPASQQFGGAGSDLQKKWLSDLQSGSGESLKEELSAIQKDLEQLVKSDDPAEREQLKRDLQKRLEALSDFANDKLNSKPLAAALKRTRDQLQMSGDKALSTEALEAAKEAMQLAELELEMVARSAEDLKDLEEALMVLQMAKQLNGMGQLDGEGTEGMQSLDEYAAMYSEMLSNSRGAGLGQRGVGEGGIAPEDEQSSTGFKTEQSKSAIVAGKILLSLKTQGLGEEVDAEEQYRSAVQSVRQGVSEAILQEQIPPGYHDGIKKYFDNIDDPAEQPTPESN